jgi:hypothetical protein
MTNSQHADFVSLADVFVEGGVASLAEADDQFPNFGDSG